MTSSFNPSISVSGSHYFIWKMFKIFLSVRIIESSTNESLGGEDGVLWVGNSLSLGGDTDKSLTIFSEGNS